MEVKTHTGVWGLGANENNKTQYSSLDMNYVVAIFLFASKGAKRAAAVPAGQNACWF